MTAAAMAAPVCAPDQPDDPDAPANTGTPANTDTISSAAEARALCASLSRTAALLIDLIDSETEVVAAGRAHEIEMFQGDKAELSGRYLIEMTRLKNQAAAVRALAPDEVATLKPRLQELGAKLLRNQDALAAVLALSERLIRNAVMNAIKADSGPKNYGKDAQIDTAKPNNPAATIDRQL